MRALTVGELLDASFSAVRRNFKTLALATLVVIVPVSLLDTLIMASTTEDAFDFTVATTVTDEDALAAAAGNLVSEILFAVGSALATAACLRAVAGDIVGKRYTAGESLQFAGSRLGSLVWVLILYTLAWVLGIVLLVVGAIWLYVLFCLNTPALLFEDKRGRKALGRSRELIEGHWWRTFGALLVMFLIAIVIGAVVGLLFSGVILVESDNEVVNAAVLTALNIAVYAIALPLTAALTTYIYFDLRVRKEGFDIALLAERIGAPGPASPAGPPPGQGVAGLPPPDAPPSSGFLPPQAPGG